MTEQLHVRARKFLQEFFNDEELTTFSFDYFPQVYNNFVRGMTKNEMVLELVAHSQRRERFDELLAALERERHKSYAAHFAEQPHLIESEPQAPKTVKRNPRLIFISHAHQDAEFAQRLATDLRTNGWETWIAPDNIQPGEKWVEAINRGLTESGIFALLISGNALKSRWVESETNAAISLEHRDQIRFVPLGLEPVSTLPLWETYQKILFYDDYDQGLLQLLRRFGGEKQVARPTSEQIVEPIVKSVSPPWIEVASEPVKANSEQSDSFIYPITGKVMVRVPAGEFFYGDDKKRMVLDEFWIDKTPVTNADYKRFLDANLHHGVPRANILGLLFGEGKYQWDKRSRMYPEGKADHPVVLVSWHDVQAYVAWAQAKLPSEEQWEKAARGVDGRIYPWGDEWLQNYCNTKESGIGGTTPAGYYSPKGDSPFGCVDMSGNVWEWTSSLWEPGSKHRVLRGGSWYNIRDLARAAYRNNFSLGNRDDYFGFRLVRRPPSHLDL